MAGQTVDYDALARQNGAVSAPTAPADLPHGDDFLKMVPAHLQPVVKGLAEGKIAFPGGIAMRTPYWQGMLSAAAQYDPDFDQVNYNGRNSTYRDFTAGKAAQNVSALKTVLGHLSNLSDRANELANTRVPFLNWVRNEVGPQLGAQGLQGRLNRFEESRQAVASEAERAWRGTGGSAGEIEKRANIMGESQGPQALHDAIDEMANLVRTRFDALQEQYQRGMGSKSSNFEKQIMPPGTEEMFGKIKDRARPGSTPAAQKPSAAVPPEVQQVLKSTEPGIHKLNDGSVWMKSPDGSISKQ